MQDQVQPENPFFWNAYMQIRRSRPFGMAKSPIPIEAISSWAATNGVDCPLQRRRLINAMIAMDDAELAS